MLWTLVVWAGAPPSSPRTAPLCKETISPVRPPAPARRRVASRGCLKQLRALACNPLPLPGVHTRPVLPQLRLPPVSAAGHTRLHQSATTLHNLFVGVVEVGEGGQGACIGDVDAEADQEAAGGQRRSPVCEVLQGNTTAALCMTLSICGTVPTPQTPFNALPRADTCPARGLSNTVWMPSRRAARDVPVQARSGRRGRSRRLCRAAER